MMDWAAAHRTAMVAAFAAQEDLVLDTFQRVDVFDAIVRDGLRLVFRPLQTSAALYIAARYGAPPGVIVHARHPLAMQRFSAAHELGHHVLGHGAQVDRDAEPRGRTAGLSPEELLAEAFAAWFLMPPEAVEPAMERLGRPQPQAEADAYALALRLGTSYRATCVHLPSLKLVKARVADTWGACAPKTIKQELSPTPPPGGWHHDVWVLTERDAGVPVFPRAGDLLLVDLPGWDMALVPEGATAELLPPADLLSTPRWAVALSPQMAAGPAAIELAQSGGAAVRFPLIVERPRLGRYIPHVGAIA